GRAADDTDVLAVDAASGETVEEGALGRAGGDGAEDGDAVDGRVRRTARREQRQGGTQRDDDRGAAAPRPHIVDRTGRIVVGEGFRFPGMLPGNSQPPLVYWSGGQDRDADRDADRDGD